MKKNIRCIVFGHDYDVEEYNGCDPEIIFGIAWYCRCRRCGKTIKYKYTIKENLDSVL